MEFVMEVTRRFAAEVLAIRHKRSKNWYRECRREDSSSF